MLSECSFRGVITQLSAHFFTLVYKMIFKQDPPYMSKAAMEALIYIFDWYASLFGTFMRIYIMEKPPHVLLKFSLDKLVMQEVSYHIFAWSLARLHGKKKAPWPSLILWIGLHEIRSFKHVDVKAEEMMKYPFDAQSYNPYDPNCLVKDHYVKVQFNWIDGACNWVEEDPCRYCYSFSRPNEPVILTLE